MNRTEMLLGYLGGGVLLLIFVWIVVALHMAYTKMDVMLEHLKNSPAIMVLTFWQHSGPWGRLRLISNIADFVTSPRKGIKNGSISAEDIENLPVAIKRKLAILRWSVLLLLGSLFLIWCIGKMTGHID